MNHGVRNRTMEIPHHPEGLREFSGLTIAGCIKRLLESSYDVLRYCWLEFHILMQHNK